MVSLLEQLPPKYITFRNYSMNEKSKHGFAVNGLSWSTGRGDDTILNLNILSKFYVTDKNKHYSWHN